MRIVLFPISRSRGRRSSLANSLSKLGIGRRSCDQDSEEGFDLMAAAEIEGSPSGGENEAILSKVKLLL